MQTQAEKLEFARLFLKARIGGVGKDVDICLTGSRTTASGKVTHAYFPGLMTTVGFADLLSGLNAGMLRGQSLPDLQSYFTAYMDRGSYPEEAVKVLYEALRHKIAHLGHPFAVFDTTTKPKIFTVPPFRRYAWLVAAKERQPPMELIHYPSRQYVKKHSPPWRVWFDGKICVSVRSLADDLMKSVFKSNGYFQHLAGDATALQRFMDCMEDFYPR